MIANALKAEVLNYLGGNDATLQSYGTHYFALMTVMPTPSGGGSEAPGVSRVAITNNSTQYPTVAAGTTYKWLTAQVQWTGVAAGTYPGLAIYDASSGGTLLMTAEFEEPVVVASSGSSITMPANTSFKIEITDEAPAAA